MAKIIECVPNFSEGRDKNVIDAISNAIKSTDGVCLLDVDPGESTNRTVYTFVGAPEPVIEGALNAAKAAFKLIDMQKHKGSHPRLGALDVCPFIPVQNVTVSECVQYSKIFAQSLAKDLKIPVYLYGQASERDYRKTMPQIRAGEYEGLKEKLQKVEWAPDFGDNDFVPSWGATVTGVRKFLIAYNVNLLSTKEQAHRIALNLREQGRGVDQPGRLKQVQAIGWYLDERDMAQISINLTDYHKTPMHIAYEEAKKDAEELKIAVTGSEVVGLVPLDAILQAAEYYIQKENLFILEESQKVHLAINRLGLNSLGPFNPKERIIEYCIGGDKVGPLASLTVDGLIRSVAARTPAPGGGSVAALVAALGGALGAMVGQLTYGKKQWQNLDSDMRRLIPHIHNVAISLIPQIDADTQAFNDFMAATKLPQSPEKEDKIAEAQSAILSVPQKTMEIIDAAWTPLAELSRLGNVNCLSDIQVAAKCLETGSYGAYYNILINLKDKDNIGLRTQAQKLLKNAQKTAAEILGSIEGRM